MTTIKDPTVEYRVTVARFEDAALLPAIELAAARLLVGYAPESILGETIDQETHEIAQRRGHLWVALADNSPVGFAHVQLIEPGAAHLDELDVHPNHGRRGLGTRLVAAVCEWATSERLERVTLTPTRDVPWNMPFYARLGFEVSPPEALTPALRVKVHEEERRGLDSKVRVVMQKHCAT
jgi:GNAT superfamily N-acetyltransferase